MPPSSTTARDAVSAHILDRAEQAIARAADRLLVERLQHVLGEQGLDVLPLLSGALLSTARDLVAALPALVRDGDRAATTEAARTLGLIAQEQGTTLASLLGEGQHLHDQLLESITEDWRASDRSLVLAVLHISRALREVERHMLLAYEDRTFAALTSQALTDALTGLANRRYFDERFNEELARAQRHERSLALILVDLDGLKVVNDSHGHAAGDALLRALAGLLHDQARSIDLAARLGGDEFALLLTETDQVGADTLLQRLSVGAATQRGLESPLRFSAGIAIYPEAGRTADALLRAADDALYRDKRRRAR